MNKTSMRAIFVAGLTLLGAMVSRALADQWDQRTIFAFNAPVPSVPAELAVNTTKPDATLNEPPVMAMKVASLKAQMTNEDELEIGEVFVAQASPSDPPPLPAELHKTGSPLRLIGLVGLLSLATAFGLRIAAKES